jgi:SAM-dependent methyltransferase
LISALGVASVLDAGCGTGRVAIELARRGLSVAGVDRDRGMLRAARDKAPQIDWYLDDLSRVVIPDPADPAQPRQFEAIVMAGNVMIFVDAGTEDAVVANMARPLAPGGLLVSGFQLQIGGLNLDSYDRFAARAGLELAERWSTWDRGPWRGDGDYAVSVHRRPA